MTTRKKKTNWLEKLKKAEWYCFEEKPTDDFFKILSALESLKDRISTVEGELDDDCLDRKEIRESKVWLKKSKEIFRQGMNEIKRRFRKSKIKKEVIEAVLSLKDDIYILHYIARLTE